MKKINSTILIIFFSFNFFSFDTMQVLDFKKENNKVKTLSITNSYGTKIILTNYGGRIMSIFTSDKKGNFDDIVLGYDKASDYLNAKENPYFGSIVGRYGNRIKNGTFSIDDKSYVLAKNNNMNHLHGGIKGFDSVLWEIENYNSNQVTLSYLSPDGDEGYPGELMVKVKYLISEKNELIIEYWAETNKKTIVNLTNHSYFNLNGSANGSIENHLLEINAKYYTPVDENLIPTGEILSVNKTPFDFIKLKKIGSNIDDDNIQLKYGLGYDHNFVLNKKYKELDFAAKVFEPRSGRLLEVFTNEPGIQFYSGNFLDGKIIGKKNKSYAKRSAFCLETQHFPDSPNKDHFPSTILSPGEKYYSICIYKFSYVK